MERSPTETGATAALAAFAAELPAEAIPAEVAEKVLLHTLDQLGAQVIGSAQEWNAIVRRYAVDESPEGEATIVGEPRRARSEWAAMANATAGHGFEIDDYHPEALSHPGCVIVPSVMALVESSESHGVDTLTALVIGYEAVVRMGLAAQPSMIYDRGFHESCATGIFGVAAAAGRLLGFDSAAIASALGIAGSHASGTTEYTQSGGEVKRLHAGLAAMGGIRAAELVRRGFSGPTTILEGRRGFFQAFTDTAHPEALVDGLGESWQLLGTGIKPYPCCSLLHAPIQAVRAMVEEDGLLAEDVQEIVIGCDHFSLVHVGGIGPHPRDMSGAQFSAEFTVAMAIVAGGADGEHYLAAAAAEFADPAIRSLAERVRLELWEESDAAFPVDFLSRVTVTRRDGSTLSRTEYAKGSPRNPMSGAQIRAKFRRNSEGAIGAEGAARVERAVERIADGGRVRDVMTTLAAAEPVSS
jgi:2-methylcitrate dehydratase PrpD